MQNERFCCSYHVPGTLAADEAFIVQFPFNVQLIGVSTVGTNSNNAQFTIGTPVDPDLYMTTKDVGDNFAANVYSNRTNFVGEQFPHILAGTNIIFNLDYDGAAGTAVQNFTMVLIFTEG